jgi:hypothetical protein
MAGGAETLGMDEFGPDEDPWTATHLVSEFSLPALDDILYRIQDQQQSVSYSSLLRSDIYNIYNHHPLSCWALPQLARTPSLVLSTRLDNRCEAIPTTSCYPPSFLLIFEIQLSPQNPRLLALFVFYPVFLLSESQPKEE